jgi:ankyrin repeat protein
MNHQQNQAMDFALELSSPRIENALALIEHGGVDVNYVESVEGRSTLFYAVASQHFKILQKLLEIGANPRIMTLTGVQALDYALVPRAVELKTNLDIAMKLIEAGANPNFVDFTNGSSVLMVCY